MNNYKFDKKLIILVGNIGSGKSTYIKSLNKDYLVLCRDSLRYMIGGGEYIFDKQFEMGIYESINILYENLLTTDINMVIDETNVSKRIRRPYIFSANTYGYHKTAVVLPRFTKDASVSRRLLSPHGDFSKEHWGTVWDMFDKSYEVPTLEEGFDNIIALSPIV